MKRYSIIFLLVLILPFNSCKEERLDLDNPNQLSEVTYFQNEAQAVSAVNAIYAAFQTTDLYNRRYFFMHDLLSDETQGLGSLGGEMVALQNRSIDGANPVVQETWRGFYRAIQRANLAIGNIPTIPATEIEDAVRARLIGEAKFLRAWHYFELVSLWGGVPLYREVSRTTEGIPRATEDEVYELIAQDLNDAAASLPATYGPEETGRATSGAANALLGRVWLFRAGVTGNASYYQNAKTAYEAVVNSGVYMLTDNFFDNFTEENEFNSESIFEIGFSTQWGGAGGWAADATGINESTFRAQEYGFRAWRNVVPSQKIQAEYEAGDPRYDDSFYHPCDTYNNGEDTIYVDGTAFPGLACPAPAGVNPTIPDNLSSWRKYQNYHRQAQEINSQSGINFRSLRYAEVLLGLAEATAETDGVTPAALELLNRTRDRVGFDQYPTAEYPTGSKEEFINAVMHERAVEFVGEQIRYRDLIRRGLLIQEVATVTQDFQRYLPIPQNEIDNNTALTNNDQNPGY